MSLIDLPFLQIEPTTRCNFTCGFCAGRHMPQQNMPLDRFEQILRSVANVRHVELQGEGEPMLHPQFFEMAELIRNLHPQAKVSLITNGSLLGAENVERILETGFHKLSVSIESPDPAAFAEIRGGKLEKVLDGIRLLMERRRQRLGTRDSGLENRRWLSATSPSPSMGEGLPVANLSNGSERESLPRPPGEGRGEGVSPKTGGTSAAAETVPLSEDGISTGRPAVGLAITVLRRTMHEFPRLIDLYDELGLDGGITFQPLQNMPVYTQHYGPEMRAQVLTPIDRWHFGEMLRHNPRVQEFLGRAPPARGFYDELFSGWDPRSGECPWLARGLYVAYNGTATGCCFIKNTARDGFGEISPVSADQVAANRNSLQSELRAGRIPTPCANCSVAGQIVAARRR
jgi:MoaA/NifB/PqqE/SkfB family radical SAM enzyme